MANQVQVVRLELLGAISSSAQVNVTRLELLGSVGGGSGAAVRVHRLELLGTGTTGTNPQISVTRLELLGSRGGFTHLEDATAGTWEEVLSVTEYDLPTTSWRQLS